jgi:hypothetical protein
MARVRRVLTTLDLEELSGVDVPAQEGATVRSIKNRNGAGDTAMNKTPEEYEAELAVMQKRLDRAEALAGMSDAEKAFMKGLDPDDRPVFVAKSRDGRAAQIKEAEASDPVVYESKRTGKAYRRSQQDLADAVRERDEAIESQEEVAKTAKGERITKRVGDLCNLSDDEGGLTAIVVAIDDIKCAKTKKAAQSMLDAVNQAAGADMANRGTKATRVNKSGDTNSAKGEYDEYVAKYAKDNGISESEAKVKLIESGDKTMKRLQKAWRAAQGTSPN